MSLVLERTEPTIIPVREEYENRANAAPNTGEIIVVRQDYADASQKALAEAAAQGVDVSDRIVPPSAIGSERFNELTQVQLAQLLGAAAVDSDTWRTEEKL